MKHDYQYLLDGSFSSGSKVWIYQSNRLFGLSEALTIEEWLNEFSSSWKSHGDPVKGAGYLFFGQFIILMADESATGVSGCSTDSSVRLMKEIEQKFGVTLFDRNSIAFIINEKVQLLPLPQLQYASDNGFIGPDTLFFNNLVQTKEELESNWIIPVKNSWLAKRVQFDSSPLRG
jgi:hypothetical protein